MVQAGRPAEAFEGGPCVSHGCSKCCYEAEMPMTEADMARLETLGHQRSDFSILDDEYVPQLRMVEGHCFFLVAGRCSVHDNRPVGCRLYPLVWDQYSGRVAPDDFCPFVRDFPQDAAVAKSVAETLATLRREAAQRRGAAEEGVPKG